MTQVFAIKPGRLKAKDRKALEAVGIVVLELDEPEDLKLVDIEGAELAASELSWAAIAALDDSVFDSARHTFVKNVRAIVTRKLQRQSARQPQGDSE